MIKKILIVDDNINLRDSLKRSLKSLNADITCAASAEDALNLLHLKEIDLVISDYEMPGMNGAQFTDILNKDYPDTKVFMLTGKTDFNKSLKLINTLELNKFFNKPYNRDELIDAIKKL